MIGASRFLAEAGFEALVTGEIDDAGVNMTVVRALISLAIRSPQNWYVGSAPGFNAVPISSRYG